MKIELGIENVYNIRKRVRKKLILNDKVIDYLYNRITKANYVYMINSHSYKQITKEILKELLNKATQDDRYWRLECFAQVADSPEYDGVPFEVEHASPYDHRWEGDYDEDAYDDWKISAVGLDSFFYDDMWEDEPVYIKHPENFDFENEEIIVEDERLEHTHSWWGKK